MKRYFCTTCKRTRRSQRWPADVIMSDNVRARTGTCRWHYGDVTRRPKRKVRRIEPKRVLTFDKNSKKRTHKNA